MEECKTRANGFRICLARCEISDTPSDTSAIHISSKSSRKPLQTPFLRSSCFPLSFLFHSFSRLFLCSSFLLLSSSYRFTDLRFTSTTPSDRPPKSDRYPLLGSKAKTLSLDNGSHIHTTCFYLFLHTK
jgi:hypothetical protein